MIRPLLIALAFLLAASFTGCDTNEGQDLFFEQSRFAPEGYTRTLEGGVIDSSHVDPDDWRIAPFFQGAVEVDPAFPNPVSRNGVVTIVVRDPFGDAITGGVRVRGYRDDGLSIDLGDDTGDGLVYVVSFVPSPLRIVGGDDARLYRLQVFDNNSRIISYGDILVQ